MCSFYNTQKGCRKQESGKCKKLHICKHYLLGTCKYGERCSRCHDLLDAQPKAVLRELGVNVDRSCHVILEELRKRSDINVEIGSESEDTESTAEGGVLSAEGFGPICRN